MDDENNDKAMYFNDYDQNDQDVKDTHRKLGSIEVKTSKVNGELSAPHRQPLKVGHLQKFDPLENNFWNIGRNCRVLQYIFGRFRWFSMTKADIYGPI